MVLGGLIQPTQTNFSPSNLPPSVFDVKLPPLLEGAEYDFKAIEGKPAIIIVNVASKCGLADKNYKGLSSLFKQYHAAGLNILAFPCQQFHQEYDEPAKIREFVNKYNVEFPVFQKLDINGDTTHPLFQFLKYHSEGFYKSNPDKLVPIGWNYGKFLLDSKGNVVRYYGPRKSPMAIEEDIKKLLQGDTLKFEADLKDDDSTPPACAP